MDIASAVSLLAFSGLLFIGAGLMPTRRGSALVLNTGFYPQLLASILAVLSVLLLFEASRKPDCNEKAGKFWESTNALLLFVLTIALLVAFPFVMKTLGFGTATFLFITVLVWLLSGKDRNRPLLILPVSLGITVVVYVVFKVVLAIPFPSGILL
jgi:DMSO/TMAO reductase YedYZ heme-binding membrane subunit